MISIISAGSSLECVMKMKMRCVISPDGEFHREVRGQQIWSLKRSKGFVEGHFIKSYDLMLGLQPQTEDGRV